MNWMGLVNEALGVEDLDFDDDKPYDPGFQNIEKDLDKLCIEDQKPTQTKLMSD